MSNESMAGFAVGVIAGAVIGGAIALLLAPKSGAETRALLKEKAEEGLSLVKDEVTTVKGKVLEKVCAEGKKEAGTA